MKKERTPPPYRRRGSPPARRPGPPGRSGSNQSGSNSRLPPPSSSRNNAPSKRSRSPPTGANSRSGALRDKSPYRGSDRKVTMPPSDSYRNDRNRTPPKGNRNRGPSGGKGYSRENERHGARKSWGSPTKKSGSGNSGGWGGRSEDKTTKIWGSPPKSNDNNSEGGWGSSPKGNRKVSYDSGSMVVSKSSIEESWNFQNWGDNRQSSSSWHKQSDTKQTG